MHRYAPIVWLIIIIIIINLFKVGANITMYSKY